MLNNPIFISSIAQGNEQKFRLLMELTSDQLLCFAMGLVKNKETAEEIVSDVFVTIWKKRKGLAQIKNLKSYLFICVKNGCITHFRKAKNDKIIYLNEIKDFYFAEMDKPENDFIDDDLVDQLYAAIESLPPKCKMAFSLAKINGLKHKEIAEVMNVSPKTVNNHLVSALKRIIESMELKNKGFSKQSPLKKVAIF